MANKLMNSISDEAAPPPASTINIGGIRVPERYSTVAEEYATAHSHAVIVNRADRAKITLTGKDRKAWLHNLVTNDVKALQPGTGCYAFAIDLRGRVLFDLDILDTGETLWLLTDAAARPLLLSHLERYHITEDVALRDESADWSCIGLAGQNAESVIRTLAADVTIPTADLSQITLSNGGRAVRTAFAGAPGGFELWLPNGVARETWNQLVRERTTIPIGYAALDALRIEAGIPWMHRDIDERVVAPESGQAARAISYRKGCYLGQEVIERMRSHGSLARRLVRISMADGVGLDLPAPLRNAGGEVGRITSLIAHPDGSCWVGLGYLKTAVRDAADLTVGEPARAVTFAEIAT